LESTTLPARFLQAKLAELPDVNYYGEGVTLDTNSVIDSILDSLGL
jgi:hypothetical protein